MLSKNDLLEGPGEMFDSQKDAGPELDVWIHKSSAATVWHVHCSSPNVTQGWHATLESGSDGATSHRNLCSAHGVER